MIHWWGGGGVFHQSVCLEYVHCLGCVCLCVHWTICVCCFVCFHLHVQDSIRLFVPSLYPRMQIIVSLQVHLTLANLLITSNDFLISLNKFVSHLVSGRFTSLHHNRCKNVDVLDFVFSRSPAFSFHFLNYWFQPSSLPCSGRSTQKQHENWIRKIEYRDKNSKGLHRCGRVARGEQRIYCSGSQV